MLALEQLKPAVLRQYLYSDQFSKQEEEQQQKGLKSFAERDHDKIKTLWAQFVENKEKK